MNDTQFSMSISLTWFTDVLLYFIYLYRYPTFFHDTFDVCRIRLSLDIPNCGCISNPFRVTTFGCDNCRSNLNTAALPHPRNIMRYLLSVNSSEVPELARIAKSSRYALLLIHVASTITHVTLFLTFFQHLLPATSCTFIQCIFRIFCSPHCPCQLRF